MNYERGEKREWSGAKTARGVWLQSGWGIGVLHRRWDQGLSEDVGGFNQGEEF